MARNFTPPNNVQFYGGTSPAWAEWFSNVGTLLTDETRSGSTGERPVSNLRIGMPFFDTTIGMPIYLKSVKPNVWVNGVGAIV